MDKHREYKIIGTIGWNVILENYGLYPNCYFFDSIGLQEIASFLDKLNKEKINGNTK